MYGLIFRLIIEIYIYMYNLSKIRTTNTSGKYPHTQTTRKIKEVIESNCHELPPLQMKLSKVIGYTIRTPKPVNLNKLHNTVLFFSA